MRKRLAILLFFTIIIFALWIWIIPRSDSRTKRIAEKTLVIQLGEDYGNTNYSVTGPIINLNNRGYNSFQWIKKLPWGDTASIFIDVYKRPQSLSFRDEFFWPRVTMNYQWNYLIGSISDFESILPRRFDGITIPSSRIKLKRNDSHDSSTNEFIVPPARLFYFLQEGYFRELDRNESYIFVEFLEPIGRASSEEEPSENKITSGAKIYVSDSLEVSIEPCTIPKYLW